METQTVGTYVAREINEAKKMTASELKKKYEAEELAGDESVHHDLIECCEDNEEVCLIKIKNPENEQHTIYSWIPVDVAPDYIRERELEDGESNEAYDTFEEAKEEAKKQIKEIEEEFGVTPEYEIEESDWADSYVIQWRYGFE